jgi:hypothetical protein
MSIFGLVGNTVVSKAHTASILSLEDFITLPSIARVIKSRQMSWMGHWKCLDQLSNSKLFRDDSAPWT